MQFCVDRQLVDHISHSKENVEQKPEPASLWWTSTYDSEEKSDVNLGTTSGCYTFPFQENVKIWGCAVDRHGKTYDAVEERMQSANKAMKKIKGWETKTMPRLFRFKRHEDETWVLCHNGPCEMARKI